MTNWEIDDSWTLFLDRDGVINERILSGYVQKISDFIFLPLVPESIAQFSKIFGHVFVVTNQQGIGKGLMTESNLLEIHSYMQEEVEKKGGKITKAYYAPGIVSAKNELRKPKPGMALLAQRQYIGIDFNKSIMVGDTDSDILFGQNLGMKTVRIKTVEKISVNADLTVNSLNELVKFLVK
jgi:histidinol-phosphate phosphatase family protein